MMPTLSVKCKLAQKTCNYPTGCCNVCPKTTCANRCQNSNEKCGQAIEKYKKKG